MIRFILLGPRGNKAGTNGWKLQGGREHAVRSKGYLATKVSTTRFCVPLDRALGHFRHRNSDYVHMTGIVLFQQVLSCFTGGFCGG